MLTMQEVTDNLGIDYLDDATTRTLSRLLSVADAYMKGAIGTNYNSDDERAKQLALLVITDLYENRETTEKVGGTVRRMVHDLSMQLRAEMMT